MIASESYFLIKKKNYGVDLRCGNFNQSTPTAHSQELGESPTASQIPEGYMSDF